eukprot:gene24937-10587_t
MSAAPWGTSSLWRFSTLPPCLLQRFQPTRLSIDSSPATLTHAHFQFLSAVRTAMYPSQLDQTTPDARQLIHRAPTSVSALCPAIIR